MVRMQQPFDSCQRNKDGAMAEVELRKVVKRFGSTLVVHGVDLQIHDSEFVVLVGPSGCGKSTVLRMIAGLEKVSDGEILIGGNVVNDVSPKDRNVAMVFQNYALYPAHDRTGQYGLQPERWPNTPGKRSQPPWTKPRQCSNWTPCSTANRPSCPADSASAWPWVAPLSASPRFSFLDEPLSNLDAQLRMQMRIELRKMHLRLKTTTIYVTHDQIEAMTLADRIVILKGGHIQQVGTPVEVFEQPSNVFVAQFIGNPPMNILSGRLEQQNDALCFVQGGTTIPLPQDKWKNIAPGQKVLLGIRPDAVKVGDALQRIPQQWRTQGKVVISEVLGAHSLLAFLHEGANMIAEVEGRLEVQTDDVLALGFDLQRASLFDPETTKKYCLAQESAMVRPYVQFPDSQSRRRK